VTQAYNYAFLKSGIIPLSPVSTRFKKIFRFFFIAHIQCVLADDLCIVDEDKPPAQDRATIFFSNKNKMLKILGK